MNKSVRSDLFKLLVQILALAILGPITVCLFRLWCGREISLMIALQAYIFSVAGFILSISVGLRKDRQL